MKTPGEHIVFARKTLTFTRLILSEEYADKAGRKAYMAVSLASAERAINKASELIESVAALLAAEAG